MSKLLNKSLICCLIILFITNTYAADYYRANLKFNALIQEVGCTVTTASQNMIVPLGTWDTKKFSNPNSQSTPVFFEIKLDDCNASTLQIKFTGNSTTSGFLSLDNNSSATNLAVQLLNSDKKILKINEMSPIINTDLQSSVSIGLYANYISELGQATSGSADATSTFEINYN